LQQLEVAKEQPRGSLVLNLAIAGVLIIGVSVCFAVGSFLDKTNKVDVNEIPVVNVKAKGGNK